LSKINQQTLARIKKRKTIYRTKGNLVPKNTRTKGNPTSKTLAHKYTKCTSMKI
jgi:hypothetical protein